MLHRERGAMVRFGGILEPFDKGYEIATFKRNFNKIVIQ